VGSKVLLNEVAVPNKTITVSPGYNFLYNDLPNSYGISSGTATNTNILNASTTGTSTYMNASSILNKKA